MLEPLLGLLLITLLAWVILLIGLPELLIWLARRNTRQRHELIQRVRRLENNLDAIAGQLEPFRALQAPQYRQMIEIIAGLLRDVRSGRQALAAMRTLRFPPISRTAWPVQHFVSHPRDVGDIITTFWRLRQLRRSLEAANRTLAAVRERLQELRQMPEQFRRSCEAVLARLGAVQALLQKEQRAGIVALGRWRAESGRLQQAAHTLKQRLEVGTSMALAQADQIGRELYALEEAVGQLEGDVRTVHQDRLAFDARRETVVVSLDALGDMPPELRPVRDVIETLLAETADLRQQLAFDRAEPLLKSCEQWLQLGKTFQATTAQVNQLLRSQHDSLDPVAINQVQAQLERAYQNLAGMRILANRQPHAPLPPHANEAVSSLGTSLGQVQAQATRVEEQFKREAREQEQVAKRQAHELVQAWKRLGRIMKLARSEPLAQRFHSLMEQRPAASGKPAALRAWALQAAELEQDILESAGYLQYRLNLIGQWMNQLSALLRELDASGATAWACLQQQADEIKRLGEDLQQRWKNARRPGWLDETHERLDDVKLHYQTLQQDYDTLDHHLYRLNELYGRIEETIMVIQQTADTIDPNTWERIMTLVESNYQHAFQALTCEEAMDFLRRAEEFASKLALQ
ncbi:MAG TPA: hypothetical protein VF177_07630 [Anaerolineae bacterium]